MQFALVPHPATAPADPPFKVWTSVDHAASFGAAATTNIWFAIGAPASRFVIPEGSGGARVAGLWQTTCFEAFLRPAGDSAYREWNFAPSGDWAAYHFANYREAIGALDVGAPPYIRMEDNLTWWALGATITADADRRWELGLSAVLEEKDGTKSYWALAHPPGDRPDFHAADCFAAKLP